MPHLRGYVALTKGQNLITYEHTMNTRPVSLVCTSCSGSQDPESILSPHR